MQALVAIPVGVSVKVLSELLDLSDEAGKDLADYLLSCRFVLDDLSAVKIVQRTRHKRIHHHTALALITQQPP